MAACESDCLVSPADDSRVASPRRKILVAVDEGDESIYALSWALHNLIGSADGNESPDLLLLLHVQVHPQFFVGGGLFSLKQRNIGKAAAELLTKSHLPAAFYTTPETMESVRHHQEEVSKNVLVRAKRICDEKRIDTETMVAHGDPRHALCDAVKKLHPDFLVLGRHGYGAVKRAFLGSVGDYCAHNAKCPVVIVKKP